MMIEIERKFLVLSEAYKKASKTHTRIVQGFLSADPERTVRVRVKGTKGFLTIKGKSNNTGTSRFEWEKEIDLAEAEALLKLCKKGVIDKCRYEIKVGKHTYEVDEFFGHNKGLVVAEIELQTENEPFQKPQWLGKEVTGEVKYYNAQLSITPYCEW